MLWLLIACETFAPTWIDQRPACSAEPYAWSDDLTSYVSAGEGDGSFDIDPDDEPRGSISGAYDPYSGEFAYETAYADGYWLVSGRVEAGFGTVWHTGDLDVEYVETIVDVLGAEATWGRRLVREGCAQTEYRWDPAQAEPTYQRFDGEYSSGQYSWTADVADVEWSGTRSEDGVETQEYAGGGTTESLVVYPDGTREREFLYESSDGDYEGTEETAFDGSVVRRYEIREDGDTTCEVEESFSYAGEGTASYECDSGDFECEYTLNSDGDCRYVCDDGQRGLC